VPQLHAACFVACFSSPCVCVVYRREAHASSHPSGVCASQDERGVGLGSPTQQRHPHQHVPTRGPSGARAVGVIGRVVACRVLVGACVVCMRARVAEHCCSRVIFVFVCFFLLYLRFARRTATFSRMIVTAGIAMMQAQTLCPVVLRWMGRARWSSTWDGATARESLEGGDLSQ
jgi:hypothetical protein